MTLRYEAVCSRENIPVHIRIILHICRFAKRDIVDRVSLYIMLNCARQRLHLFLSRTFHLTPALLIPPMLPLILAR